MLFYKWFHDLCLISRSTKHFLSDNLVSIAFEYDLAINEVKKTQ